MSLDFSFNMMGGFTQKQRAVPEAGAIYDVIVLGGGPAGLNAALYAKRKGLEVAIFAKRFGGQVLDTSTVENYLGFDTLTGEGLSQKFMDHLDTLAVPMAEEISISTIGKDGDIFVIGLENGESYRGRSVIVALGSRPRRLGVPGEETYAGKGVAYCAICDGPLFKGKTVTVAGGGNSAVEAALDLAKIAAHVILVHRSRLRADAVLVEKLEQTENIEVHLETKILEAVGDEKLTGIKVERPDGVTEILPTDGLFIEIGYLPNSQLFDGWLELNGHGEIVIDADNRTSLPGVFAAGDITVVSYKQIAIAVGEGAKAALSANAWLNSNQ